MKRTEEQVLIHTAMRDEDGPLMVNAVAGGGKTSTIVTGSKFLPRGSTVVAFNKAIATELETRLPPQHSASTFNALGFRFLRDRLPNGLRTNGYKSYDLIDKHTPVSEREDKALIARLVSAGKSAGIGIHGLLEDDYRNWEALMDNYDLYPGDNNMLTAEALISSARTVLEHNEDNFKLVDFDDQLYLTLKLMIDRGWKPKKFPVMMVDEAQDTNGVQALLVEKFTDRAIMVGDRFQAIYGFRGAGVDSMKTLSEFFGPKQYDLSYTFRCAESIVNLAQTINPGIKARPDAPNGIITGDRTVKDAVHYIQEGDLVICRNNFPLIRIALDLLKNGVPFSMSGKYPKQLIDFVKSFKAGHLQMFRVRLKDWWDTRKEDLEKKEKWGVLQREEDKFNSLWELQAVSTSIEDLIGKLEYMTMNKDGPRLATIHSSKGLEADTVHFIMPELLPSKYATQAWQLQQEDNLRYVATTRAKNNLHMYSGD